MCDVVMYRRQEDDSDNPNSKMREQALFQEDLFELLTSPVQLREAWKRVKSNRGAAGVDGVTIDDFELKLGEEIKQLSDELRTWSYNPSPVRRVEIPKPGTTEKRKLGIPCVRDRVLHQSLKMVLEPYFEPKFSASSFGFRPGRGQQDAISQAKLLVDEGKDWCVDIDLEKFFDRINQDRIIHLVRQEISDNRVLRLLGLILRSGVMTASGYEETLEGSPQGSPVSPLLSNIVLDELDKELEKRGLSFSRFADDAKIYVGSRKAGERVMRSISTFIEKRLKLKVNQAKSKVAKVEEVVFLGFVVTKQAVVISKKSFDRAMAKTKELVKRRTHVPLATQIEKVNQWYQGWANYYSLANYPSHLQTIEAHIRRRFRAQFVRNQKRRRHLAKKFIRQGVSPQLARKTAYSHRKWWALSRTVASHRAWGNDWFRAQGLKTVSDKNRGHWKPLRSWIKPL